MPQGETKPPLRFRKLRTAWSVFCGLAAVLIIALWARSYWRFDFLASRNSICYLDCVSNRGSMECAFRRTSQPSFLFSGLNLEFASDNPFQCAYFPIIGFGDDGQIDGRHTWIVWFPHWLAAFVAVVFAATPWTPCSKRFTLRTLLMATTLVAVVLGSVVWLR
jgi:hypothetical protein